MRYLDHVRGHRLTLGIRPVGRAARAMRLVRLGGSSHRNITALCQTCDVAPKHNRRFDAIRNEWNEAPWFVLLIIAVSAFVGPMLIFGAWNAVRGLF